MQPKHKLSVKINGVKQLLMLKLNIFISCIIFLMLISSSVFTQTQPTQDVFNMGSESIVIDGNGEDVAWSLVPEIEINQAFGQEQPSLNAAFWKSTWNNDGIYFLIEVDDDVWMPDWVSGLDSWLSDKIELYIDCTTPQKDGLGASSGIGNHQVAPNFSQNNMGVETEFAAGIMYADTYNGEGKYTIEYYIPFTAIPNNNDEIIDPYVITSIGFDVTVIDLDDVNIGRNRMVWANTGGIDESWNNMDDVGLINFVGESTDLAARFSASNTIIGPGTTVEFTDFSTGEPTSWLWSFGDGETSINQHVTHTYNNEGTYTVELTVANSDDTVTTTKQNYITVTTENLPPQTEFMVNSVNGKTNETIQFTDQSLFEPTSWRWYFGDGSTSSAQNPQHIYTKPGVYSVSLFTANENGNNAETKTDFITIIAGDAPTVNFEVDKTVVDEDTPVQFFDLSSLNPIEWHWDFGDGNDSEEQNPSHVYMHPGTYTVSLTATNSNGTSTLLKENYIEVAKVNYTAINNIEEVLYFYPNPAHDLLNIETAYNNFQFQLIDINGNAVIKTNVFKSNSTIDISNIESGIYFAQIISGNILKTEKIIVN